MSSLASERSDMLTFINTLDEADFEKVVSYAAFLRHIEEQEEAEDIAYYEAHKNAPSVPLEDALKELGI